LCSPENDPIIIQKGAATMRTIINTAESCEWNLHAKELTERELSSVTGGSHSTGRVSVQSLSITKHFDKA
jgi:bacteriocin-like protein